jgi:hypothetical protein
VLVESVRTEAGPRHKHICYLGTVREGKEQYVGHQIGFWRSVDRNLDRAGISEADRARIFAKLEAVVPRPTEAKVATEVAELEALSAKIRR